MHCHFKTWKIDDLLEMRLILPNVVEDEGDPGPGPEVTVDRSVEVTGRVSSSVTTENRI